MRYQPFIACVLLAGGLALAGCVQVSGVKSFHATLSGAQEVPPVPGKGSAQADVKLDMATHMITWSVSYTGLSGPPVAAHIHGPAAQGSNAGVMVPFKVGSNPMSGSTYLTDPQIANLMAGNTYINIHTEKNKAGEIRGQLAPYGM
jgi:hypothetical protein